MKCSELFDATVVLCPASSGFAFEVREAVYCGVPVLVAADSDIGTFLQTYSADSVVPGGAEEYTHRIEGIMRDRTAALAGAAKLRCDILRDSTWEHAASVVIHAVAGTLQDEA